MDGWMYGWMDVQGEVVEAAARQNEIHPDYSSSAEFSHHSLRIMEVLEEEEEEEEKTLMNLLQQLEMKKEKNHHHHHDLAVDQDSV
jgi:hypothetical protein